MSTVPPGRYGSEDFKLNARIDALQDGAPLEFDTLSEVAAELQSLRTQIAALQGGTPEISFLLIE